MILPQIYTVIFATILAWLNRIPCRKMIDFGASIKEEKEWHKVNAIIKLIWTLSWTSILFYSSEPILHYVRSFFLLTIIQWAVFDVVLSKLLYGGFFYLGKTSAIDRRFRTIFGVQEGFCKFLICVIIIVLINLYL